MVRPSKNCSYGLNGAIQLAKTAPPTQIAMISRPSNASLRCTRRRRTEGPLSGAANGSGEIEMSAIVGAPFVRVVCNQPLGGGFDRYAPRHRGLAQKVIGL